MLSRKTIVFACLFMTLPLIWEPAISYGKTLPSVIVIDPGHGGIDSGTTAGSILEKDIVLSIGKDIAKQLEKDHVIVYMTRDQDKDASKLYPTPLKSRHRSDLLNRVRFFHEHAASMVISLHVNHSGSSSTSGALVFYQREQPFSTLYAPFLQDTLNTFYTAKQRPLTGPYYILRAAHVPVFLLEIGFLSNPSDREKLTNPVWQHSFATSMTKAIELGLAFQWNR
ncbi:N-acetylmuramoyl-L-alanine amidase [Fodinisporobacter ferrooxydans]|uniref:N-acetylmuramoyl-L-alanine amidase n=1 Tax=Fodinisporobacter ferrooxydans TaxID=2901836 RepID=A0ABY4CQF0_9BACL|nr:N-acetylmuramoyl-L-alanine amidase [Alicyclobacillaceae bacterium MYW30-H2]